MQFANLNLIEIVGTLIGGLALFLFGLELMTRGLKAIAGARLQGLLGTLTASRIRGVFAGAGITALLNSSTITTVLLVGFVSAGLMTLQQSIPVIMGANIGSTLTAQIIAFDISAITPFMLAGGFLFYGFSPRELLRQLGGVTFGLGLLFLGIQFMGDATRPLRDYEPFIEAMQDMHHPLLGIVIGAVFTAIVQSSAATLAIVIALGSQGLIPLESGIALILGANVGTCGTALLASIGKSAQALQVGIVHLLFNVLGVLFLVFVIPQFADFIRYLSPSSPELTGTARLAAEMPRQVANAHTVFSVFGTVVLIWFTGPIGRLAERLAPQTSKEGWQDPGVPRYLDAALVEMPALAITRVQLELVELGKQVQSLVKNGAVSVVEGSEQALATLTDRDRAADTLSTAILTYIGQLSEAVHSDEEGRQLVDLARIVTCLDAIREVATTSMLALSQRRLAQGADVAQLRSPETVQFAMAVIEHFTLALETISHPSADIVTRIVNAKPEIEAQAGIARRFIMSVVQLRSQEDALNFRLANDMIEHLNEVARLSRAIAKASRSLNDVRVSQSH
ncbi:MAG: Na/Pi cotransporter family protein [Betaproteobacteria bacterium]|nr:Na/Pi cotransporter family protein [Betaproteobacteria bacterium]